MARIILFNKPCNVLSQFTDASGRRTLGDYIPLPGVYPAGRLDYDSEGLMVLTDNGRLQHQISQAGSKLAKTYWLQVEGDPDIEDLRPMTEGIVLPDGPCRPASATLMEPPAIWERDPPIRTRASIPTRWIALTLHEGRNRQARRMTAAVGFPTLRLVRAQIGQWTLGTLAPGEYRVETVHPAGTGRPQPAGRKRTRRPRR